MKKLCSMEAEHRQVTEMGYGFAFYLHPEYAGAFEGRRPFKMPRDVVAG